MSTVESDLASAPVIDDLSFADLLRIALEDAPGASQGRWTVHGPVDPGITLVELFAWQLEQRLFMADQVTDPIIRASLRLIGVAEPSPALPAATILSFVSSTAAFELPAGTSMNLDGDPAGRRLTLDQPVSVLPIGEIEVLGQLRTDGDTLELRHHYAGPRLGSQTLSLLVDVEAAPGVEPSWSPGSADVPPGADLMWSAVGPDGREMPVAVDDQTGGFRRSGVLRLKWPQVWNGLGPDHCLLRIRARRSGYTEAVVIRGVHANAVSARDRHPQRLELRDQLEAFLPLPDQRLVLPGTQGRLMSGPDKVSLRVIEPDGTERVWVSVSDWNGVGPGDRVFVADRVRGQLVFGDGRAGRILRSRSGSSALAEFAEGGGAVGNAGPDLMWVRDGGSERARNPLPAVGGRDPEPIEVATLRAGGDLPRADRTVTVADAEDLARATPGVGVQRVHATVGLHPLFDCMELPTAVSVTVVPFAARPEDEPQRWTRAPLPDDGALAAVGAQLRAGRLIGQEVFVLPPVYRGVSVWLTVSESSHDTALEARITDALLRFLDPLKGGPEGQGWPFGGVVRPSALVGVVRTAVGPEAEVGDLSVALDDGPATNCADLEIGSRELVYLSNATIALDLTIPSGAGLR